MALTATTIEGTGFSWVRLSDDVTRPSKPAINTPPPASGGVIVVIEDGMVTSSFLREMETSTWNVRHRLGHLGFQPVDVAALFPGEKVRFLTSLSRTFDFDAWARRMCEVPADIDTTIEREGYGGKPPVVVARTLKKGRLVNVRATVPSDRPFPEAIAEVYASLQKKAPAPMVDLLGDQTHEYTCGTHVQALMGMLDATGLEMVRSWLARDREGRTKYTKNSTSMRVPGSFLIGSKVETFSLSSSYKSNAILAEIKLVGGHTIKDDETGSSVEIEAQLPEAVVAALRKRSCGDIFDVPWAAGLTVRTVPTVTATRIQFRAFSDNVPFVIETAVQVPSVEIERRLKRAFIDGRKLHDGEHAGLWSTVDETLAPILARMDRETLSTVLCLLELTGGVDLEKYGHPGWKIHSQGDRITIEQQPKLDVVALGLFDAIELDRAA